LLSCGRAIRMTAAQPGTASVRSLIGIVPPRKGASSPAARRSRRPLAATPVALVVAPHNALTPSLSRRPLPGSHRALRSRRLLSRAARRELGTGCDPPFVQLFSLLWDGDRMAACDLYPGGMRSGRSTPIRALSHLRADRALSLAVSRPVRLTMRVSPRSGSPWRLSCACPPQQRRPRTRADAPRGLDDLRASAISSSLTVREWAVGSRDDAADFADDARRVAAQDGGCDPRGLPTMCFLAIRSAPCPPCRGHRRVRSPAARTSCAGAGPQRPMSALLCGRRTLRQPHRAGDPAWTYPSIAPGTLVGPSTRRAFRPSRRPGLRTPASDVMPLRSANVPLGANSL